MPMLAAILIAGGLGGAAFHPPAAALAHRLGGERRGFAMSVYITGGTLGFSLGPLLFAPFAQRFGLEWTPLLAIPGWSSSRSSCARVPPIPLHPSARAAASRRCAPTRKPLGAALLDRRAADAGVARLRDVRAGDADAPRHVASRQAGAAVALYLFASGVGGFFGGPAADRSARGGSSRCRWCSRPVPVRGAVPERVARSCSCSRSAGCFCSRRCRSTSRSARRWRRSARPRCRR